MAIADLSPQGLDLGTRLAGAENQRDPAPL
jgi:hypothetical protein